jgi:hypothetical protein
MSEQKYTVDYFIEKFEGIPSAKWCTDAYIDPDGRCCAIGHCGQRRAFHRTAEAKALANLFSRHIAYSVPHVNDVEYMGKPTPKQRVLAALRDIKAKLAA